MKNSLLINAFFSVTLSALLVASNALPAHATNAAQAVGQTIGQAVGQAIAQPQTQALPQASITLVSPAGNETYISGNRYPISWHANIPQINTPYHLIGEIRLLDQNGANKKDLRIARLTAQDLAKGTYEFRAGAQTDLQHDHVAIAQGQYKIWIFITGYTDCVTQGTCAPLFEATALSNGIVTLK